MSNGGEVCCILSVCCDPLKAEEELTAELQKVSGYDADGAAKCAKWIMEHFDLAPKGSLEQLKHDIARMARKHPHEGE